MDWGTSMEGDLFFLIQKGNSELDSKMKDQ